MESLSYKFHMPSVFCWVKHGLIHAHCTFSTHLKILCEIKFFTCWKYVQYTMFTYSKLHVVNKEAHLNPFSSCILMLKDILLKLANDLFAIMKMIIMDKALQILCSFSYTHYMWNNLWCFCIWTWCLLHFSSILNATGQNVAWRIKQFF